MLWLVVLAVGLLIIAVVMGHQDARGLSTLRFDPLISLTIRVGGLLIAQVWWSVALVCACTIATSLAAYRSARRRLAPDDVAILAVVSLAVLAEAAFLLHRIAIGVVLCAVVGLLALRRLRSDSLTRASFGWRDVAILIVLTAAAAVLRFYALNRITDVFEGELAPYYLAATRLAGIPLGNAGVDGPWAPLGYLFYVPVFLSIKILGPTVLAIRFSSAAVALCTLTLLYLFTLHAYGRTAAVLSGVFYMLDPLQIGWARTDVHPHGVTAWPALLIALVSLRAFAARGTRWFVLLAILMAVTWHQYPSGQTAAFIPVLVLVITVLRRERVPGLMPKVALLAAGLAGWLAGPMMTRMPGARAATLEAYFTQLGTRVAVASPAGEPLSVGGVFRHAAALTGDVIAGLFVKLRYVFHQDIFVPVPDLPSRSISWIVAALVLAGAWLLVASRQRSLGDRIVLSWIAAGIIPAIFSDHAFPKRSAMLFPALLVLAAAAGARFFDAISRHDTPIRLVVRPLAAIGIALWFCGTSWLWFSGVWWHEGIPNESLLVQRVRAELTPGTIVVARLWHNYGSAKLTYLLSDVLRDPSRAPVLWRVATPEYDLQSFVDQPALASASVPADAFFYRWPGIPADAGDRGAQSGWSRVVYILQTGIENQEQLRARGVGTRDRLDEEWVRLLQPSCGPPRLRIAPRTRCDDCGFVVLTCPFPR